MNSQLCLHLKKQKNKQQVNEENVSTEVQSTKVKTKTSNALKIMKPKKDLEPNQACRKQRAQNQWP